MSAPGSYGDPMAQQPPEGYMPAGQGSGQQLPPMPQQQQQQQQYAAQPQQQQYGGYGPQYAQQQQPVQQPGMPFPEAPPPQRFAAQQQAYAPGQQQYGGPPPAQQPMYAPLPPQMPPPPPPGMQPQQQASQQFMQDASHAGYPPVQPPPQQQQQQQQLSAASQPAAMTPPQHQQGQQQQQQQQQPMPPPPHLAPAPPAQHQAPPPAPASAMQAPSASQTAPSAQAPRSSQSGTQAAAQPQPPPPHGTAQSGTMPPIPHLDAHHTAPELTPTPPAAQQGGSRRPSEEGRRPAVAAPESEVAPAAQSQPHTGGATAAAGAAALAAAAAAAGGNGNGKHASFAAGTAGEAGTAAYTVKGTVKELEGDEADAVSKPGTAVKEGKKDKEEKKEKKDKEDKKDKEGKKDKEDKKDRKDKEVRVSKSKKDADTEASEGEKGKGGRSSKSKSKGGGGGDGSEDDDEDDTDDDDTRGRKKKASKSPHKKHGKSKSPGRRKGESQRSRSPDDYRRGDDEYSDEYYDDFDDYSQSDVSRGPPGANFQGDVSAWGRANVPDFYTRGHGSASSDYTLSSGLSPRDLDGKTHREFDLVEAQNTLAYNAGLYGRAQALRKAGQAPKVLGIADDLPDRFAFHQLEQLAGMARKVQDAIEHNKRVFQKRVEQEDLQIKKKAFNGWRAARYGTLAKQQLLRRVLARMQRFKLARAFFAWKDRFGQVDKNWAMRRKLQATIGRGRLRRCFDAWRKVLEERWWKRQLETRDQRIHALEKQVTGFEMRPIIVIRRRRLDAILTAWFNLSAERRRRRMRFERAGKHFMNIMLGKAWNSWYAYHLECQRRGDILKKAALRMKNVKLAAAWNKWWDLIVAKKDHLRKLGRALGHWKNSAIAKAWDTWWQHVLWRREKKRIIQRWKQPLKAKAFYSWIDWVAWRNRMRVIMDRTAKRMLNSRLAKAWDAWRAAYLDSKMDFHLSKKEELALQVKALSEENERLRRDNERFVRLIDSGEWGRGRVSELVSAGEVLKGERDALLKLIQSMRKEYEAVQSAKGAQDDELRRLKERMLLGGAARNKMLVKGASSYNALKRAIKQDLVEAGAASNGGVQDPNLLYEIDKLAMDRVAVFPDGDLNIEAVSTSRASAAFARPVSAVQGGGVAQPPYPMHMPQGLVNLGQVRGGAPAGSTRLPANSRSSERVVQILNRLQSLTPAEIDRVEERLRAEAMARAAAGGAGPSGVSAGERGPPGLASTAPTRR